jgi:hypothetical protein
MIEHAKAFVENNKVIVKCESCDVKLISPEYINRFDENGEYKYECLKINIEAFTEGYDSKNPIYSMGESIFSEFSSLAGIFDKSVSFTAYVDTSFDRIPDESRSFNNIGEIFANVKINAKTDDKEWCCIEVIFEKVALSDGSRLTIWQANECIGKANMFLESLNGANLADKTDQKRNYPLLQIKKMMYFNYFPKVKKVDGIYKIVQGVPRKPLNLNKDELKTAFEQVLVELDPKKEIDYEIHIRLASNEYWSNAIFYVDDTDEENSFCEHICSIDKNPLLEFAGNTGNYWFFLDKKKKEVFEKLLMKYCKKYRKNRDSIEEEIISRKDELGLQAFIFDDGECIRMPMDNMGVCLNGYYWNKKDEEDEYIHITSDNA